jgi:NAD(P)-dependent dehydrogenase (short-subunit alcohol dehydrogenase family)
MPSSGRLDGKVAVITGAASGLGAEAARLFAAEGAAVVVADVNTGAAGRVVAEIDAAGGKAIEVGCDVTSNDQVRDLMDTAVDVFGAVHVLYNNAGIFHPDDKSVLEVTDDVWNLTMDVNVKGVMYCCRHGIPKLLATGGGSIINVSSMQALLGSANPQAAYTASKGAVLSMTKEIAVEFARRGIRANALCPGPVMTPLLADLLARSQAREHRMVHIPMGRFGEVSDVAKAALFLASEDSSYITGATFTVDGGITAAYTTPGSPEASPTSRPA